MKEILFLILSWFGFSPVDQQEAEQIYTNDLPVIEYQTNSEQITSLTLEPETVYFDSGERGLRDEFNECSNLGGLWITERKSCLYPEPCHTLEQCQAVVDSGKLALDTRFSSPFYEIHNYNAEELQFTQSELFNGEITNKYVVEKGSPIDFTKDGYVYLQTCSFPIGINEKLVIWEVQI